MRWIFFLVVFSVTASASKAQFSDTTHYLATYTSTGSINKTDGNSAYLLNNGLKFNVRKKSINLNFNNNWLYGKQNEEQTNNDYSAALDFNLYKTFPNFFYWGLANYNTSFSLQINNQLLAGGGVAYNIVDRENAYLNVSNGLLYDASGITLNDDTRESYQIIRNSFRLMFRFAIVDMVTISGSNFVQHSLQDGQDYIIKMNEQLDFRLTRWISLTAALTYNRINRTQRENLLLSYGLTFERYF